MGGSPCCTSSSASEGIESLAPIVGWVFEVVLCLESLICRLTLEILRKGLGELEMSQIVC